MVGLDKVTSRCPLQPPPFGDPAIFEAVLSGCKEDIWSPLRAQQERNSNRQYPQLQYGNLKICCPLNHKLILHPQELHLFALCLSGLYFFSVTIATCQKFIKIYSQRSARIKFVGLIGCGLPTYWNASHTQKVFLFIASKEFLSVFPKAFLYISFKNKTHL